MLEQQLANGIFQGSVYALFAVGYALVFGILGALNLAHAAIFMWGAMAAWAIVTLANVPFPVAIVIALALAAALGVLTELIGFRPLRGHPLAELSPLIASIAIGVILQGLALRAFGADPMRLPADTIPRDPVTLAGVTITPIQPFILMTSVALVAALHYMIRRTSFGRQMRAVAADQRTAAMLGIDADRVASVTFLVASFLGGVAGILLSLNFDVVSWTMGDQIQLKGLTAIVLGGMGSIPGAAVGGLLIGLLEVLSVAFLTSQMRDAVIFVVFFAVLLLRPRGIFGRWVNPAG
jgi:branched-chain amino acid transport system permease protein